MENNKFKIAIISDAHSYGVNENSNLITNGTIRFSGEVTKVANKYASDIMLLATSPSYKAFNSNSIHILKNERFLFNNLPQSSQTHGGLAEKSIIRYLDAFKPNVVSIPTIGAPNASVAHRWAQINNIPIVTTIHSHPGLLVKHALLEMGYDLSFIQKLSVKVKQRIQNISNSIDTIIVRSSVSLNQLQGWGLEGNYEVLKGGVDKNLYKPSKNKEEILSIREKFNLDSDSLLLLFVGRFSPAKKSDEVIQILKGLKEINKGIKDIKLVVIGNNSHYNESIEYLQNQGIIFLGELDKGKTADVMKAVDMGIAPNEEETFGQAIAEMMASGLVCAIPNIGGHLDFATEKSSLILSIFDEDSKEYWVNNIYNNLLNTDYRKKIAENAVRSIGDISDSYKHFIQIHREAYFASQNKTFKYG